MKATILVGDCRQRLRELPDASVQCVVTSPPYWGLRDYGTATWEGGSEDCDHVAGSDYGSWSDTNNRGAIRGGPFRELCGKCGARRIDAQLGLEPTPEAYVAKMVEVFRDVRRVLRDDGTLWLNLGDSYASKLPRVAFGDQGSRGKGATEGDRSITRDWSSWGLKEKQLAGMPWRTAFALQADGWYLRSDIIWSKPNPMPESVTDRPTKAHEYVFLLTKSARYYFDQEAVREPHTAEFRRSGANALRGQTEIRPRGNLATVDEQSYDPAGRNIRSVWTIATQPFPEAHFATYPEELAERCVKAGTSERGACATCGAPWARTVESAENIHPGSSHDHSADLERGSGRQVRSDGKPAGTIMRERFQAGRGPRTTGWVPTCGDGCPHHYRAPMPCVVLDPFAGSGTTGVVALNLGRSFVGIELNPAYAAMAERRIANVAPLLAEVESEARKDPEDPEQLGLDITGAP